MKDSYLELLKKENAVYACINYGETDFIANASEEGYSRDNITNFINKIMTTESGKRLTEEVFCL